MLIIIDFDDTLVATSKCIVPLKYYEVVDALRKEGLDIDREEMHKAIMEVDKTSPSARDTFKRYLASIEKEEFYDTAVKEYTAPFRGDFSLEYVEGAEELLESLKDQGHTLLLLSAGREDMQFSKMKKVGLDLKQFIDIIITFNLNKLESYKKILEKQNVSANDCIAIGDKYKTDLLPAHSLGIKTILFRYGRGINDPMPKEMEGKKIDYAVNSLFKIPEIIKKLEKI